MFGINVLRRVDPVRDELRWYHNPMYRVNEQGQGISKIIVSEKGKEQ